LENKFKNEMLLEVAGEQILLRPTFENIAQMETKMGSIASLAFKYGRNFKADSKDPLEQMNSFPPISECAQIIYYNQAEKTFTQEEIFQKCLDEGIKVGSQVMLFLVRITAGNKMLKEPSEFQKKNQLKKSRVEKA